MKPVSCVRVQKGSRARIAYHNVPGPLGLLQPLHRLLLCRGRSLLGLHRFLQLLPGGPNEVGSAALSGAGRLARGCTRCGCLIALSLGPPSCANRSTVCGGNSQALALSFDLQCCCSWAKSCWRRRYSSCACLALACCASILARASASDCDCGSGSDCGWDRRSGCTAAADSALHACRRVAQCTR